jgi:beta-mannosidase
MNFRPHSPALALDGAWSFAWSEENFSATSRAALEQAGLDFHPCTVPGALETDLQALGKFPDPFLGLNALEAQKYERHHVWYVRHFRAETPPGTTPELVFEGLDTFAEIYLNGQLLGRAANMLIEHVFPVDGLLREENELLVHFRPAVVEAEKYSYPPGLGAQGLSYESLHVRKAPHMYGWDIMPRIVSAGIWRPVRLRFLPPRRIETAYLETVTLHPDGSRAELVLHYQITPGTGPCELIVEGACSSSRFAQSRPVAFPAGRMKIAVERPELWWPRGSGEAKLYEVTVRLKKEGVEIDRLAFTHGIRTIELERTSVTTEAGDGQFRFKINGEPIFIKGSNWVPADAFHWRDAERIPRILPLAVEAHCNLLRGWGGNVYEGDAFFDGCDRAGILIWQDFAMACAVYPQDAEFQAQLREEARQVVRRLRQHASLALWAGDNECDQAHAWFGAGDPNKNVLTRVVLPEVLKAEDPGRPYLPSSPYIDEAGYAAGEKYLSEYHLWGPRDYFKSDYYAKALCHFASETGYEGIPAVESMRLFLSPDKLWPPQGNDEWILHSINPKLDESLYSPPEHRVNLMLNQVRVLFGTVPETLEDFVFASQASQAEGMKFFVERFRHGKENWRRSGIVWWNLMDGWPQLSDSVVDYYFRKKLAFHFIRRAQQDVCIMLREPAGDHQEIVAVNDLRRPVTLDYTIVDISDGREAATGRVALAANTAVTVGALSHVTVRQTLFHLSWSSEAGPGCNHYLAGPAPFDLTQYRKWLRAAGCLVD